MTRAERALRKANRLELQATIRAARATGRPDALGRAAIAEGASASRDFRRAAAIREAERNRAAAAGREKRAKKLTREWWRKGA